LVDKRQQNVIAHDIVDNETWAECPSCHAVWKEDTSVPTLLYNYVLCANCKRKVGDFSLRNHLLN
jgi:hypothetical protein